MERCIVAFWNSAIRNYIINLEPISIIVLLWKFHRKSVVKSLNKFDTVARQTLKGYLRVCENYQSILYAVHCTLRTILDYQNLEFNQIRNHETLTRWTLISHTYKRTNSKNKKGLRHKINRHTACIVVSSIQISRIIGTFYS